MQANKGFAALIGLKSEELAGAPLTEFTHPGSADDLSALVEKLVSGERDSASGVLRLVRPDGEAVWVELFAVSRRGEDNEFVGLDAVARDVSEHLEVADLLSRVSLEQKALLEAQQELLTSLDFDDTLQSIVERAYDLLDARIGVLFLLDEKGLLTPTATTPEHTETSLIEPCRVGEGVVGHAVEDGGPRYVPNIAEPGKTSPLRDVAAGRGSMLVAPLQSSTAASGALAVVGSVGQYQEEDLDFLVALSQIASLAIVNSETHRAVERLATVDPLTGSFNRRFLEQNLSAEMKRGERIGYPLGALMMDVDDLKAVNDRYGHTAGDEVLRHVVEVCRSQLRETDWIVRYGGDEFLVVLPGCGEDSLRRVAEKLWSALSKRPIALGEADQVVINMSMGGAISRGGSDMPEELIEAADRAERAAKRAGVNQFHVSVLPSQADPAGQPAERDRSGG